MQQQEQNRFSGWAVVELFGHSREAGYVTTEYFGQACLFRVDVPEVAEAEFTLDHPEYVNGKLVPAGSVVKRSAVAGRTRMIGPGAVYAMNPGTEEAVRKAVAEANSYRPIAVVKLAEQPAIESAEEHDDIPFDPYEDEDDGQEGS